MSEQLDLIEKITTVTGARCHFVDDEIICTPAAINKPFMVKLISAMMDSSYTFMVNRNLDVIIFKP